MPNRYILIALYAALWAAVYKANPDGEDGERSRERCDKARELIAAWGVDYERLCYGPEHADIRKAAMTIDR